MLIFFAAVLCVKTFPIFAENNGQEKLICAGYIADTTSGVKPNDAKVALEVILNIMVEEIGFSRRVKSFILPDLDTAVKEAVKGKINVLTMTSIEYLKIRDLINMRPEIVPIYSDAKIKKNYLLIVQKEKTSEPINMLKNKKIIVEKGGSGKIALLWLNTLLLERSLPESSSFFLTVERAERAAQVLLQVFFGQADACVLPRNTYETMVELNPQIEKKLSIISESPGFLCTVTCISSTVNKKTIEKMMNFIKKMHTDPSGRQIMLLFRTESFCRYNPDFIITIEKLYKKYNSLRLR